MKELKLEELLVIDGGACSWSGAGYHVAVGGLVGAIGGPAGAAAGSVGGGVIYAATCWW